MPPAKQNLINAVGITLGDLHRAAALGDEESFFTAVRRLEHISRGAQLELIKHTVLIDPEGELDPEL